MNGFVWLLLALFMLSFVGASSPPTISNQPQSPTVLVGQAAVFGVTAAGEDLSYQWLKNGQDIPGATLPSFFIESVQPSDGGSAFQVRVTNDKGNVVSCTAKLTVIESGNPSSGPPECPAAANDEGGGGCGSGGGGGGGGGGSTSSASSSGGSSGDPQTQPPPDFLAPYPVTRWKGSVKATTVLKSGADNLTTTIEGEVTFASGPQEIGLFPSHVATVVGSLTLKREGTGGGCSDSVTASGTIKPNDGQISFQGDPPLPERATEVKYNGLGVSFAEGTQTRVCPSTTTQAWTEQAYWMMTGDQQTTSSDLDVISGSYVYNAGTGSTTTFEWNLVKQR